MTLGVILGLLVLQNMCDSLPDLLDRGAGFGPIVYYYGLSLPAYCLRCFRSRSWSLCSFL